MNRLLKGLREIPAVLLILLSAASFPVWAGCTTGSGNVQLNNINVNNGNIQAGDVLYSTSHTIKYTCQRGGMSDGDFQTYMTFTEDFRRLLQQFQTLGLGVNLTVMEKDDKTEVTGDVSIPWADIQNAITASGRQLVFGPLRNSYKNFETASFTTTIKLELFINHAFTNGFLIKTLPGMGAINIVSSSRGLGSAALINISGFSIRIFSSNLGSVDISPLLVHLGRFYTTDTQKRSEPFTITARQKNAANDNFPVALRIRFASPAGLTLTDEKRAVLLKNKYDSNNNGLQLSIEDNSGGKVTFDNDEEMGDITMGKRTMGSIQKQYTAVLNTTGDPIKTGDFEVAIPVVITYN